jgi:hypothetical protein
MPPGPAAEDNRAGRLRAASPPATGDQVLPVQLAYPVVVGRGQVEGCAPARGADGG